MNFVTRLFTTTNSIYNGVNLLIHKKDSFSQKWRIIDSEGGEIQNEKFQFNGMTYLRRSVKKSEEIIEESICIKWIKKLFNVLSQTIIIKYNDRKTKIFHVRIVNKYNK